MCYAEWITAGIEKLNVALYFKTQRVKQYDDVPDVFFIFNTCNQAMLSQDEMCRRVCMFVMLYSGEFGAIDPVPGEVDD